MTMQLEPPQSRYQLSGRMEDLNPVTPEGIAAKARAEAILREHGQSGEAARAFLISLGILTPTGHHKNIYGGKHR